MRRLSKKLLAVLLAAVMAIPTLLAMPFAAQALTEWTPVASSDFTQANAVSNGSLGQIPTYENQGSAMTWSTNVYTGNGEVSKSSDGALYVPDGYIYLSGYEGGAVPIKDSSNWRIEFGFRFKDVQENGIHVTDGYHADEEHCFIKMYKNTTALSNPSNALHNACYFEQNANGQCYAGSNTVGEGIGNPDNAVCTGSKNLTAGENYKYVAEFSDGIFKAYIQDENGAYVQFINETDDSDFIDALTDTSAVNSIKIGDDDDSAYFRSLEYRYIVFSTGVQTGTIEDQMKEAIELYETKMGGDIFTGMTDAYDAYVTANKVYDAWKYGDGSVTDEQLVTATKNLRKKSVAMKQWSYTGVSGVTPWYAADSGSTSAYADNGVANVLYWAEPENVASNTYEAVKIDIWAPSRTVLLLDGVKTPAMPIMAFAVKTDVGKNRYVYNLYPCVSSSDNSNSTYFRLGTANGETAWYGHNGTSDRAHNWIDDMTSATNGRPKGEAGTDASKRLELTSSSTCGTTSGTARWASFSNVMKFVGSQSDATTSYSLNWSRLTGDEASNTTIFSTSNSIQVINYKMLLDKMNNATNLNTINVSEETFTQGGLRSLLVAYDKATSFSVSDYDYSNSSSVSSIGSKIDEAVTAFNNASVTEDVSGYDALRKAIAAKQVTYRDGAEGYTEESWAAFAAAYEAAEAIFTNIQTTGYNDGANAKAKADALNAVELVTNVDKVDSTNLEIAIDEATVAIANRTIFTNASYSASNISAVVEAAKNAVWGAASNYPNAKFKLDLSDENTAIVEEQFDFVKAAVYALKIDKTTTVSSAGEHSMESAIAEAANYSSEDYGNYTDLASAVSAANSFAVSVTTLTEGCITSKIADYKTKVRAIINAINLLRPAFDKITNGTIGSFTDGVVTEVDSLEDNTNPRWRLYFIRNNNLVVFRTQYEAFNVDLGGATIEWYDKETDAAAELDSINIYDENDNTVGEVVTHNSTALGNPDPVSIDDAQNTYPGMLSASTDENSAYTIKNITTVHYDGDRIGFGMSGESITDTSTILDEILSTTQGSSSDALTGTVTAKGGKTTLTADFSISIPRESKKTLSATTLPVLTEHTLSSNIGMVYYWKRTPFMRYIGYSHNRTGYTQTTYVMNIAPLMELITRARGFEGEENNYQVSAWNAFTAALTAARADMNYGSMTASEIESACQTRYTNLWNAYKTLTESPAATNTSIHAAIENENIGDVYKADNKDGRWSASRWASFKEAYEAAAGIIATNAKYSDANVRDYGPSEQTTIDAYATAVTTTYNELITYGPRADFTALENAATRSGYEALEDDKYTASSLAAVAQALADADEFPYLNMTKAQRNAVYSETADIQAIAAEVTKVENVYASVPVEAVVDATALAAAKTTAIAKIKDPDAYGNIDEIKALIDETEISENVTLFGNYKVSGIKYETQEELNAAVETLLAGLTAKAYTITVVDENNAPVDVTFKDENGNTLDSTDGTITLDYGTKVIVYAPDEEELDWFYSYKSNTSEQASKYYTTDMWVHLTVRGDTTLKVKSAAQATETVKVTYVNALTGKTFAVDYAAKNEAYSLQEAPILAYYNFLGYSLEADSEDYVTAITPAEDTIVFANYEFDTANDFFTITLGNINGSITTTQYLPEDLEYNDLVEFTVGDGTFGEEGSGIYQTVKKNGSQYKINGEVYSLPATTRNPLRYTSDEIYAWVVVKEDDMENWDTYRGEDVQAAYLPNVEKVVMYGDTYSFRVCENVYVIPYSESEFDEAVSEGLIEGVSAEEKAAVYASDKVLAVKNDNGETQKISMIGNFTLPEGGELVEVGMLFKATTDGTVPEADLTLGNAGTNGIARMKSSSHTAGNQYVISVNTKKFIGTNTTIGVKYRAYLIYTDGTNQYVVYSDVVTDSAVIE